MYPHPSPGKPGEGAPSSPGELAYGTGPRNVSSGTLTSSPLLPVSGCAVSPLTSFGGPSPPTSRAPLRMAPSGAAPRTVQVTEAAPLPDPSRRGDQRNVRCPVSRFGRDAVGDTVHYYSTLPRPRPRNTSERSGGGGDRAPCLGIRPSGFATPSAERDGWFRDGPKSARPRPPLRTESAPLEAGEIPGAMSRSSRRPHPPQ